MRAYLAPAALLALSLAASRSPAQTCRPIYVPQAPNTCGPGFYVCSQYGVIYGPNYFLRPDFLPFQGMVTGPKSPSQKGAPGQGGPGGYPGMQGGPGGYPGMQGGPGGYPGMQGGPGGYPGMQGGPGGYASAGPGGQGGKGKGDNLPGLQPLPGLQGLPNLQNLPPVPGQLRQLPPLPGMPGLPPVPPMAPFQGIAGQSAPPRHLSHPFVRSPRDFFMLD
jgi:hypothetical protein